MKKECRILGFLLAILLLVLSGCSPSAAPEGSDIPVENNEDQIVWLLSNDCRSYIDDQKLEQLNALLKEKGFEKEIKIEWLADASGGETTLADTSALISRRKTDGKQTDLITPTPISSISHTTSNKNKYYVYVKDGLLAPITDYLKTENGKKIYDLYDETYWKAATIDGEIYATRNRYNSGWAETRALAVNKTLLDQCGISLDEVKPEDFQSLCALMERVYTNENVTVSLDKVSPLTLYDRVLTNAFPIEFITKSVSVNTESDELQAVNVFEDPEVKAMLRAVYDMSLTGYVNPHGYNISDVYSYLFQYATSPRLEEKYFQPANEGTPFDVVYIRLEPLCETNLTNAFTGIASWSQNQDAAFELLYLMHTDPEISDLLHYGVEGEDYVVSDGHAMIEDAKGDLQPCSTIPALSFPGSLVSVADSMEEADKRTEYEKCRGNIAESRLLGFWFDFEPVKAEADATDAIFEKYINIWSAQGIEDFDATYDALLAELKEAGIDRLVEEANRQLDAWQNK